MERRGMERRGARARGTGAGHGRGARARCGARTRWPEAWAALGAARVGGVGAREAARAAGGGAGARGGAGFSFGSWGGGGRGRGQGTVLVDVRPEKQYDEAHAPGSVNVPLFRSFNLANGASPLALLKAGALLSQGVEPTEENPDFVDAFRSVLAEAGASRAVLCDAEGGTLDTNSNFPYGKESRALTAAYKLLESGFDGASLSHLEGGLNDWAREGLPFEGTGEYSVDARTPVFKKQEDRFKGPNGQFWDKDGNRVKRGNFAQKKSGTGMSQGMNPLDPFGTWSVEGPKMLENLKSKGSREANSD